MSETAPAEVQSGEILFVKSVKDGIPNRDPLRESDARRLFGPDDGRVSLSDVSIKRDVRDYVLARHPDGGPGKRYGVFVQKKFNDEGSVLLGRGGLAQALLGRYREANGDAPAAATTEAVAPAGKSNKPPKKSKAANDSTEADLLAAAFDVRAFGAVFSVEGRAFNRVGPVQFGWAHSLHPVETKYVQGTVCMPSSDAKAVVKDDEDDGGRTQGTIWTMFQLPFAVFAMPAVVNKTLAANSKLDAADIDLLLESLWNGTLHRQARGRGRQQPLFLLHVEYVDPFFRLGYLEESLELTPGRDEWAGSKPPAELRDVTLKVGRLAERLNANAGQIKRARLWADPMLKLDGELPAMVERLAGPAGGVA